MRLARPSGWTWALTATALGSAALLRFDPWAGGRAAPPIYSTQSAARRVFPELGEAELARASVTLALAGREPVRIVPGEDGLHVVHRGEAPLGWIDAEALSGLWSSLRMATTLRAVAEGSALGGRRGEIVVERAGGREVVALFGAASDGVGVYAELPGAGAWVVEPELAEALAQSAEAWLSRRLLPVETGEIAQVRMGSLALARGEDGLWRVAAGGPPHLLSEAAVAIRLDRIVGAEFDPLAAGASGAATEPWLELRDRGGRRWQVGLGPACAGEEPRREASRGPGLRGCVDAAIEEPWPIAAPDSGLVEPQLVPYAYGRVLAVQQAAPGQRRLRRFGGGWVIEEEGAIHEVAEPEVFRWWSALQGAPVEVPAEDLSASFAAEVDLSVETDSGQRLRLRCGPAREVALACRRDEGPPLVVARRDPLALAFARETFADRRLLAFGPGEVREIEVLPGSGSETVRQGVRLDLGVWRLDAPAHPDGAAALDEVRLEALLAALQSARAEVWTDPPATAPLRSIRVERGAGEALTLELHAECVAHVPGQRQAAALTRSTCATLAGDLLYNDPLRFWLGQARRVELAAGEATATALREADGGLVASGDPGLLAGLAAWEEFRAAGLVRGEPPGAAAATAKIHRPGAVTVQVEVGALVEGSPAWVRLVGSEWYYRGGGQAAQPEP